MALRASCSPSSAHLSDTSATAPTVAHVPESAEDVQLLLTALRRAVAAPGAAERPGRLRQQLDAALGPEDSTRMRRQVHQIVAAAEENVPHHLRRISPLTAQSLQRLSDDLAAARGWRPDAAQRTTQLWATALGFADVAASSWPRAVAPPGEATLLPPSAPAPPAPSPVPRSWPRPPTSLARHATMLSGEPAVGATLAYAGMNLTACVVGMVSLTVLLCLPVIAVGATGFLLPLLGLGGARLLIGRLDRGALVASATGLEFVPYDISMRTPRSQHAFGAPWSQVEVGLGRVSALRFAGRRVQVGPRNRSFAEAASHWAGRVR